MQHAEKICQKIKSCRIPFSPKASIWIRQVQVYYSLFQYHKGRIKKCRNLKQAAQRCNIQNPLSLTVAEILEKLKACKKECAFYQEHGKQFRWKHLNDRLRIATKEEDKEAITKITAIIQQSSNAASGKN
jgi:hypothetical protein